MVQGYGNNIWQNLIAIIKFLFSKNLNRVDEERTVKDIQHEISWGLKSQETSNVTKQTLVQVIEGLTADRLDMAVVRDEFTPAAFSLSGWLGGWVIRKL